jgi:ribosomal subunit interface protein
MRIEIQARNFSLTNALRNHIQRRLGSALSARADHIQRVQVRLSDINGPRGGDDKCCLIQITLPRMADVVIENTEDNLYNAIDRAAERVSRTLTRKLGRQRNIKRAPVWSPAAVHEDAFAHADFSH